MSTFAVECGNFLSVKHAIASACVAIFPSTPCQAPLLASGSIHEALCHACGMMVLITLITLGLACKNICLPLEVAITAIGSRGLHSLIACVRVAPEMSWFGLLNKRNPTRTASAMPFQPNSRENTSYSLCQQACIRVWKECYRACKGLTAVLSLPIYSWELLRTPKAITASITSLLAQFRAHALRPPAKAKAVAVWSGRCPNPAR